MLSSKEIRKRFIKFFEDKGHKFVPSSPVVPADDPSLLFTNAGMNQFKDIFLGVKKKDCHSAVNSQKCIRVSGKHNDLEEVGVDTYHHTFFEMLGNWSFDSYFKEESIKWAWELLTEVYGIDESKLYATVFSGDESDGSEYDKEAAELWPKVTGIPAERVLSFGKKDNFWEMGETGPCGPSSEIHIDLGDEMCDMKHVPGHECGVNAGCARFIELWNLVFIQFNRQSDGTLTPLKAKYIDTGLGLERLTAVLQRKPSNYDTDLFTPLIKEISGMANTEYTHSLTEKTDIAMRVVADHVRALSFAITDGAVPSNDGRGYVLRRILRRASRFGRVLELKEPFIYKLVPTLIELMGEAFPEIKQRQDFVETVIESEEESFNRTLDRGLEIFEAAAGKSEKYISGEDTFKLYDTYGFPLDLTELLAREKNLGIDREGFDKLMEEQRQRARAAKKESGLIGKLEGEELPKTDDREKYLTENCKAKILGFAGRDGYKSEGELTETEENTAVLLDKTCCYAESGGQIGDTGEIRGDNFVFEIEKTEKIGHTVLHQGKILEGKAKVEDEVEVTVSGERNSSRKNHTATHLLQWALKKVMGNSITQQGSLVCPDYLRFDFTCSKALSKEQITEVEDLVNGKIFADSPVTCATMPIDEAKKLGATALFGEKYGDTVRLISIGRTEDEDYENAFSKELCGGTHVSRTSQIGGFKIIKEESVSAGVRRITALTGRALIEYFSEREKVIEELCFKLKVPFHQLSERTDKLIAENKKLKKQIKDAGKEGGGSAREEADKAIENAKDISGAKIIAAHVKCADNKQLRECADSIKKRCESLAALLVTSSGGKVMMVAAVSEDLIKKGIKAGDIVKQAAPAVGGGGGGRPDMAQAGGKDASGIPKALKAAEEYAASKLE
ncbi:alanine--tRNA ligase [Sedimentisphaera salicampi]|uniref:Alanine--tRNA ligase n=1 Tax=Sedimentisphaera salicampi TaxID=1941349 RepID=A0A1W6LJI2_9BACT|nr:alanine--tRNA ligase [Sedimentisphaera salicampi]ARN55948.1 Alanine--tRNA ligase [Sedimentisphaera salicampi]